MDKQEFLDRYTRHLNDKQLEAVQVVDGAVLLLAVPGSGKTTVLVNRLGYISGPAGEIRPGQLVMCSDTAWVVIREIPPPAVRTLTPWSQASTDMR